MAAKSALPAHLKSSAMGNGAAGEANNAGFRKQHHGKSQSHVVSGSFTSSVACASALSMCCTQRVGLLRGTVTGSSLDTITQETFQ